MWKSEKSEKLERVSEEESGKVEETVGKIDIFPRNDGVETVETVEIKSEVESKEPIQEEPKEEPREEPEVETKVETKAESKAEPKAEPKVETKVETKVEPSRVSLKQKLRKNMLFRFKSRVCSTFTPPLACKCPPNRDIRS